MLKKKKGNRVTFLRHSREKNGRWGFYIQPKCPSSVKAGDKELQTYKTLKTLSSMSLPEWSSGNLFQIIKKKTEEALTLRTRSEKQIYLTVELWIKDGDIKRMKRQTTDWKKILVRHLIKDCYKKYTKYS